MMMARVYFLLLLLLPMLGAGQDKPFNYKEFEGRIKKYINSNPDSTRAILNEAMRYKNLHDTIKGNLYNINGIYYASLGIQDSAIHYYKRSITTFKDYPKMKTRPMMNIANVYRNKGEYDESFSYLNKALDIAVKNGYKPYEANIYSNMSTNYQSLEQYDKAVEFGLKGVALLKESDPGGQLPATLQRVANTYMKMRNFNFARDLYLECLQMFKKQGDNINYSLTLINYAECLNHLKDYKNATKALDEAIIAFKKVKNNDHLSVAYSKVANIAVIQKNYTKAVDNYELALALMTKLNSINAIIIGCEYVELLNKIKQYEKAMEVAGAVKALPVYSNASAADKLRLDIAMAETYSNTDDDKMAIAGLQRAIKVKDSINNEGANNRAREIQAKFQTDVQREKNLALAANNTLLTREVTERQTRVLAYVIAGVAIILLILLVLRGYWLKNRLQEKQLKTAEADVSLLQKQHLHEQELTNTQREMIDEKQRELTSTALRMANYQDSISHIIQKCDDLAITKIPEFKKELVMLVKHGDYWKQFETRFNNLHPDFGASLQNRYNKLTKNDVEFCSLLKLNLSNKEIASLLQISHESAITKKYRIKKKMEINDDEEFEKLLMAI
jgi:tetratricopeptide (TPR) repeat protein